MKTFLIILGIYLIIGFILAVIITRQSYKVKEPASVLFFQFMFTLLFWPLVLGMAATYNDWFK